jgi:hypothetical protein
MESTSMKQTHQENEAWHDEAKHWVGEATGWQHEQRTEIAQLKDRLAVLEQLARKSGEHVDALTVHMSKLESHPRGTVHEHERNAHKEARASHAALKRELHDALGHAHK